MQNRQVFNAKLERIDRGEPPAVLDLFCGCGGLSLGFHRAGFQIVGGLELDEFAVLSHATNFHKNAPPGEFEIHSKPRDITATDPRSFLSELGFKQPQLAVDVIAGGPPCPSFTRVGRAKLREIFDHPEAFKQDPRSQLYVPYLNFVRELAPLVVLLENVPDFLNFGGHNLGEEICDSLEGMGYVANYTLLNAANYGVPQMRERVFILAFHQTLGLTPSFPQPICKVSFPNGYEGTRSVALKTQPDLFQQKTRFVPTPKAKDSGRPPVTVEEAIRDLPPITGHLDGTIKRGARKFDLCVSYRDDVEVSSFIKSMREWPNFESDGQIFDHVIRSLSARDYRLFKKMKHGDDYPKAYALATKLFGGAIRDAARKRHLVTKGSPGYERLKKTFVPPYDPLKFPNKWRKMEPDLPARTLMAHLGKDSYSHIHYDSEQSRVLSVREAARLQSFPDGFKFCGTMNPAFRQIGNAVPPLLGFAIAGTIMDAIQQRVQEKGFLKRPEAVNVV
jgi:DNA (cytosine-5)-methyltransferase 1